MLNPGFLQVEDKEKKAPEAAPPVPATTPATDYLWSSAVVLVVFIAIMLLCFSSLYQHQKKQFRVQGQRLKDILTFQRLESRENIVRTGVWSVEGGAIPTVNGVTVPADGCPKCCNKGTPNSPLVYDNGMFYWDKASNSFGYVFLTCYSCGSKHMALFEQVGKEPRWLEIVP